jgi:hypothetical protein
MVLTGIGSRRGQSRCRLAGLSLGVAGAAVASRGLSGILFGVSALDTATDGVASTIMLLAAVLASAVPTLRASVSILPRVLRGP